MGQEILSVEEIECLEQLKINNRRIYSVPYELKSESFCLEDCL